MIQGDEKEAAPRILVVDDDETTCLLIAEVVRHEIPGVALSCASDGDAALRRVADEHPSLLILNIVMPGKSGVEVLAAIRAAGIGLPVILTSGYLTRSDLIERGVLADPRVLFLQKPFRAGELTAAMQRLLGLRRRTRAARRRPVWRPGR